MKKWTVMLIPHDRGERREFELRSMQVWLSIALLVVLAFYSGFLFQRNRVAKQEREEIVRRYWALEQTISSISGRAGPSDDGTSQASTAALRAEYAARDAAITSELSQLYDLEAEVRAMTGLPPRTRALSASQDTAGGKGGPEMDLEDTSAVSDDVMMQPAHIIYGLSRPSADLMLQEIELRTASLEQLLHAMEEQRDRIAHTPSVWPTNERQRWISSKFGRRRDPITRRMRHHNGLDIATHYGSPVLATAKGVVSYSSYTKIYGHLVKVDHGYGLETWYGHLSKRLVKKGDPVERGEILGKVGNTGRSTGTHIHYEVQTNGKSVDPKKYLGT